MAQWARVLFACRPPKRCRRQGPAILPPHGGSSLFDRVMSPTVGLSHALADARVAGEAQSVEFPRPEAIYRKQNASARIAGNQFVW